MEEDKQKMREYLELLFKNKSNEEYIKIAIRHRYNSTFGYHYFKLVQDAESYINTNKGLFDIYAGLATTVEKSGDAKYLGSRNCLAFDFDSKDYKDNILTHRDIIDAFKSIGLYYHLMIDSGHGYHIYIYTERTTDIERITNLNKRIAEKLGADIKGTLPTQILRVPQTFNYKDSVTKGVNTVYKSEKIRPYTLDELERRFARNTVVYNDTKERKLKSLDSDMYCVAKMLEGVPKGHRNTCLGRITKYYQLKGYSKANVREIIREWNNRCLPPKEFKEVDQDFERYWETDYKLLGCDFADERLQSIVFSYCDKYSCKYHNRGSMKIDLLTEKEYILDNNYLEDRVMRKLKGYDYLVLSILITNENGLNTNQIQEKLTPRRGNNSCISKPKLYEVLTNLVEMGYLECTESKLRNQPRFYKVKKLKNYGKGYTRLLYSASILMINKCITQNEYLIYIYLARNLQKSESMSYDNIANALDMEKSNISRYVTGLEKAGLLQIDKVVNGKGVVCNRYTILG